MQQHEYAYHYTIHAHHFMSLFFLNHMEKYKTKTNALIGCYYVTEQSNDQ